MSTSTDVVGHAAWLAARSSGIVAYFVLGGSTLLGLLLATGGISPARRMVLRPWHEAIAVTGLAAVVLHGVFLLLDPWLHPGLGGVLVPFQVPVRSTGVAFGIVAAYLGVLLGPSYYLRSRVGPRRWRSLHRLTPVVFGLATVHLLLAGSDGSSRWLRLLAGAIAGPVLGLSVLRLVEQLQARPARPRPAPEASPGRPPRRARSRPVQTVAPPPPARNGHEPLPTWSGRAMAGPTHGTEA